MGTEEFSPEACRPHPKAGTKKEFAKGRKRRSTAILTDTPEKEALEIEEKENTAAKGKENNQRKENHKEKCEENQKTATKRERII